MKKILPLCLFLVLSTCSGMNGIGQLMIDAGEVLADAGSSHAQTASSRTLTADTDLSRLEQRVVTLDFGSAPQSLVSGPIVITTLTQGDSEGGVTVRVWIAPDAMPCGAFTASFFLDSVAMQGFLLKQGEKLCASSNGKSAVLWAGYRPY